MWILHVQPCVVTLQVMYKTQRRRNPFHLYKYVWAIEFDWGPLNEYTNVRYPRISDHRLYLSITDLSFREIPSKLSWIWQPVSKWFTLMRFCDKVHSLMIRGILYVYFAVEFKRTRPYVFGIPKERPSRKMLPSRSLRGPRKLRMRVMCSLFVNIIIYTTRPFCENVCLITLLSHIDAHAVRGRSHLMISTVFGMGRTTNSIAWKLES